jgi:hypothetical protein
LSDERVPTDNSVSTAKLQDGAVNQDKIINGAVSTAKLADDAVTFAKMQDVSANRLLGSVTGGEILEITCKPIGRDLLDSATEADARSAIGAQVAGTYATTSDITTAINNVIDSAPGALDTLNELAAALGDDASFSTTVTNSIATKMPLAGGTFTGDVAFSRDGTNKRKIDFGAQGAGFSANATDFDYIRLYTSGSTYAGMGITTSNMNVGTKGAINLKLYANDNLMVQYASSNLTRHYCDQFFNTELYVAQGNTPTAPKISVEGDSNTGIYFPANDQMAVSCAGSKQVLITSQALEVTAGAVYAPVYRSNTDGTKDSTAYGRTSDGNTGIYFPAANQVGISSGGNNRVNFNANASTFHRNAGQPTIKADTGNSGYMVIDSAGGHLSLNHYVGDDVFLCYALGGSGDVIIGASTTNGYNPDNRKLLVEGDTETKGITYSDRYIADTNGSATDPAFEIDGTVDGTGWYTPSSMVNGGNNAGYGFAIAAAHNHVAEFGYKSHIGNGRPTIYNGARAALLELNGNSRRSSLFGYNIYNTSSSMANEAIGGEFYCVAQGGTSSNDVAGFKSYMNSQGADGTTSAAGYFHNYHQSATGTWSNVYGVRVNVDIPTSSTGNVTTVAALYIDSMATGASATYGTSPDGIDNRYAIFQDGDADYNRFDGRSYFRNRMYLTNNSRFEISTGSDIRLSDGSASSPTICFIGNTNTGISYDSGLAFSFDGTAKITIAAQVTTFTNQTRIPDGTQNAPSLCFTSDTDTGLSYTSNNLNLVHGGANKISIGSGGVTIGNVTTTLNGAVAITQGLPLSEIAQGGATSGQTLQWSGSAWSPATPSGGGGGASSLNGLNDVTITGTPSDNSLLRYDSGNSVFENYNPDSFTSSSGGGVVINLADGNKIHSWTCASSGIQSVILLNIPSTSGISCSFTLVIKYPGSGTTTAIVQWPSSFKWPGGTAPTLTNTGGKTDTFTFLSLDNGSTWLGHVGGQNF